VAKEFDPEMLPALAIGLFAGLRRSELFALDWSEIDHEHRTIEVKGIKAKTRQRRLVSVADNLLAWTNPHRKTSSAITPERNIDVFSERLRELAVKAGITPWPHNYLEGRSVYADRSRHPLPAMVLLDLDMRLTGGLGFLDWRTPSASFSSLPVIIFSAFACKAAIDEALAMEANTVIAKPFEFEGWKAVVWQIWDLGITVTQVGSQCSAESGISSSK